MVLLALQTLHTTSYIDEGEASIILLALQPLHSPPTSTKAKHPSWQTEKMCLRQELFQLISRLTPHDEVCRWTDGFVGTSNATHYLLHRRRRSMHNLVGTSTAALTSNVDEGEASIIANREDVSETGGGSYKALLVVAVSFKLI
eukprot:scaffold1482_cov81-Skeletonema_marinoi.AAC.1